MAYFTDEEFHVMLSQLSEGNPDGYTTLYEIAKKTLFGTIRKWCNSRKHTVGYEEDVMQEVHLRLFKTCVTGFLMRDGVPNDNPAGFKSWMFTVAKNIYEDIAKKLKKMPLIETDASDDEPPEIEDINNDLYYEDDYDYEALNRYFEFVLDSGSEPHIVLTWVAVMLAVVRGNLNRSESTAYITCVFNDLTMDEVLDYVVENADKILWLQISEELLGRLRKKLNKTDSEGQRIGGKKYCDFYMKKGDRASVSDWVNRMNGRLIEEELEQKEEEDDDDDETPDGK